VIAADGGEPRRLTLGTGPEAEPSFSLNGASLGYSTYSAPYAGDLALVDLRTKLTRRIGGARDAGSPAISPDRRLVVFSSNREGAYDLWAQPLEGGTPSGPLRRLTDSPGNESRPVFSADGKWLAFTRVLDSQRDLWIMPAGGGVAKPLTDNPAQDMHAAFSPDGSRLAFVSDRAGNMNVWSLPLTGGAAGGPALQLSDGAATDYSPWWSPDGQQVAFVRLFADRVEIWLASGDGSRPARFLTAAPRAAMVRWLPRGLFCAARWGSEGFSLRRIDAWQGTLSEPLLALGAYGNFDISADGGLLAFEDRPMKGDVWVLDKRAASRR
jgi:Tol biopolymer transport system component